MKANYFDDCGLTGPKTHIDIDWNELFSFSVTLIYQSYRRLGVWIIITWDINVIQYSKNQAQQQSWTKLIDSDDNVK